MSGMPFEDQEKIKDGKLAIDDSSEKERLFDEWLSESSEQASLLLNEKHKEIISLVDGALAEFRRENGLSVPAPQIYYLTEEQWDKLAEFGEEPLEKMRRLTGLFDWWENRIFVKLTKEHGENRDLINFVGTNIHERLHQLAHKAVQFNQDESVFSMPRAGLEVKNLKTKKRYFSEFDEAVISYFAGKLTENVVNGQKDLFGKDLDRVRCYRDLSSGDLARPNFRLNEHDYAYGSMVTVVRRLMGSLAEARGGGPEAIKKVEKIFINAEFKGNLLDLGKEVAKLYGKGGLRVLAHLNEKNIKDILNFVDVGGKKITQNHYAEKILPPEEFERYLRMEKQ